MTVEQPFFETDGSKREKIISHISSMPDEDKNKYSYIWLAELGQDSNPAEIVQFDGRGNEQSYSEVKDKLNKNNVASLYWVPVEAGRTGYGVKTENVDSLPGLLRRGYIQIDPSSGMGEERGFAYRIEADGKYLYVSDEGETVVTEDSDLNVTEQFAV